MWTKKKRGFRNCRCINRSMHYRFSIHLTLPLPVYPLFWTFAWTFTLSVRARVFLIYVCLDLDQSHNESSFQAQTDRSCHNEHVSQTDKKILLSLWFFPLFPVTNIKPKKEYPWIFVGGRVRKTREREKSQKLKSPWTWCQLSLCGQHRTCASTIFWVGFLNFHVSLLLLKL